MCSNANTGDGKDVATCVVIALTPALCQFTPAAAILWALVLVAGTITARAFPLRWVALGWIGQTLTPAASLPALAATGMAASHWMQAVFAGLGGVLLSQFIPGQFINAGVLLVSAALAVAVIGKPS